MKFIKTVTLDGSNIYINVERIEEISQTKEGWVAYIGDYSFVIKDSDAKELTHQVNPKPKVDYSKEIIKVIVEFNRITGKNLDTDPVAFAYSKLINKRMEQGAILEDFIKVIQFKFDQWGDDEKMKEYVMPSTLFRPSKFTAYLQEAKNQDLSTTDTNTLAIF